MKRVCKKKKMKHVRFYAKRSEIKNAYFITCL